MKNTILDSFKFNFFSQLEPIAKKYYQLSSLKRLNSSEEEELCQILKKAEQDSALSFLISEIDNDLEDYFRLDEETVNPESSSLKNLKVLMSEWNLEKYDDEEIPIFDNGMDDSQTSIDSGILSSKS